MKVELVWFDSIGAKSSCVFIETQDVKIIIDPGAAVMQKSYPLSPSEKYAYRLDALRKISEYALKADLIVITHYHYDHHILPSALPEGIPDYFRGKKLLLKNPNYFINRSQWSRARKFLKEVMGDDYEETTANTIAVREMIAEVMEPFHLPPKAERWFSSVRGMWEKGLWVKETQNVFFADGRRFKFGGTQLRFTPPLFHGSEIKPLGWVCAMVVECGHFKFLYASDVQGPSVELYARWIIEENPDFAVIDGPPTYLAGYRVSFEEIRRSVSNMIKVMQSTSADHVIYDHHPLREKGYREKLSPLYEKFRARLTTAAEYMGTSPLIDALSAKSTKALRRR